MHRYQQILNVRRIDCRPTRYFTRRVRVCVVGMSASHAFKLRLAFSVSFIDATTHSACARGVAPVDDPNGYTGSLGFIQDKALQLVKQSNRMGSAHARNCQRCLQSLEPTGVGRQKVWSVSPQTNGIFWRPSPNNRLSPKWLLSVKVDVTRSIDGPSWPMRSRVSSSSTFLWALQMLENDITTALAADLLVQWPTLAELQKVSPRKLRKFFYGHR
jgi:hypothetical protein